MLCIYKSFYNAMFTTQKMSMSSCYMAWFEGPYYDSIIFKIYAYLIIRKINFNKSFNKLVESTEKNTNGNQN